MKAILEKAFGYQGDNMNLPVQDVGASLPFYQTVLGFRLVSHDTQRRSAVLTRDKVQIGLAENGGDPTQEGCFFEVENLDAAFREIKGKPPTDSDFQTEQRGDRSQRAFFEVAPDGLCYMIAERT